MVIIPEVSKPQRTVEYSDDKQMWVTASIVSKQGCDMSLYNHITSTLTGQ